jgi:hypothetical protein
VHKTNSRFTFFPISVQNENTIVENNVCGKLEKELKKLQFNSKTELLSFAELLVAG